MKNQQEFINKLQQENISEEEVILLFEVEELENRLEMTAPPAADGNNSKCNETCSSW